MDSSDISDHKNIILEPEKSTVETIFETSNSQDFKQKTSVVTTLMLEIYRVLMGAFLVIFVPQKCDETICTVNQNVTRNDTMSIIAISFNSITLFTFLVLYFIEVKRENKLITYLEVNKFEPLDNDSVGSALKKLPLKKKNTIWNYDLYYKKAGNLSTIVFVLNAIISSVVLYGHYLDSKTVTVYLTNVLFMGSKVYDVYNTVNTKRNIFYSAYLKKKVQFNDVDPDKIVIDKNNKTNYGDENVDEIII
tara:strand:+ start:339 stop:1085 length:747 start_codon:yes stop_codon:yes gene_type:complete